MSGAFTRLRLVAAVSLVLVPSASCYRSRIPHVGTPVEVVTGTISPGGAWVTGPVPAVGAHVVATRCRDQERREADVGADGVAWLEFDAVDCFTVTVVNEAKTRAVSVVDAAAPLPEPIALTEWGGSVATGGASSISGTITGRLEPSHEVSLEAGGFILRDSSTEAGSWIWTTRDVFAGRAASASLPESVFLVAIEWADGVPVNGTIRSAPRPPSGGRLTFEVRLPSPPAAIVENELELTLPTTGTFPLAELRASGGYFFRRGPSPEPWLAGSVETTPLPASGGVARHRLHASEPALGWPSAFSEPTIEIALHRDADVLGSLVGVVRGPLRQEGFRAIPPLDAARWNGTSPAALSARVGAPGHVAFVLLNAKRAPGYLETPTWQIFAGFEGVLDLEGLPPLPTTVTLDDLGLAATDIHVKFGAASHAASNELGPFGPDTSAGWEIELAAFTVHGD